ncbi:MAG TPA: HAD-IA family hydrolase [Candidatus Baltobacteraceae bacterium]|jgi:sugar-phosphatase|nr:HAD-IA family hydrolase [Candidatus Baltobacteraceae bacterium]
MNSYEAVLFDLYGTLVDGRGEPIDGAARLLEQVHGSRWAIVTSCPQRLALGLMRNAGLPSPTVLVTSDDVSRGKPAPECYLLAAERLGADPRGCLVLEDSTHGVQAARAAGMDVINVSEVALRDLAVDIDRSNGRITVRR